jgi:hypothetical protein
MACASALQRFAPLALAAGLLAGSASGHAAEWAGTAHGGVQVVAFDRRETRRIFRVSGTATVAFDGYASGVEAVFVLTTRRGPCLDSGKLDESGPLPVIRLGGRCRRIAGLVLGGAP